MTIQAPRCRPPSRGDVARSAILGRTFFSNRSLCACSEFYRGQGALAATTIPIGDGPRAAHPSTRPSRASACRVSRPRMGKKPLLRYAPPDTEGAPRSVTVSVDMAAPSPGLTCMIDASAEVRDVRVGARVCVRVVDDASSPMPPIAGSAPCAYIESRLARSARVDPSHQGCHRVAPRSVAVSYRPIESASGETRPWSAAGRRRAPARATLPTFRRSHSSSGETETIDSNAFLSMNQGAVGGEIAARSPSRPLG